MKRADGIVELFLGLMNAKVPRYAAAGVNVDWFDHSVNSRMLCQLSYWAFEESVYPGGTAALAASEPRMGGFIEHMNE
mgnify:CR=1 FL=1